MSEGDKLLRDHSGEQERETMCGDCRGKCGDKRVGLNIFLFDHQLQVKKAASCLLVSVSPQPFGLQGFGRYREVCLGPQVESQTSNPITLRLRSN